MIRLNDDLFLLPENEIIRGTIGCSSDVVLQHTLHAWVQFLDSSRVTDTNLGIMAQWQDRDFITFLTNDTEVRKKIAGNIQALATQEDEFFFIDEHILRYLKVVLSHWDKLFFTDWMRCTTVEHTVFVMNKPYYCGFVQNMFGVETQYLRQKGKNYYFVQRYGNILVVPNVVSIEQGYQQIASRVQKLASSRQELWNEFCLYFKKTFGIDINYGRSTKTARTKDYWQRNRVADRSRK